MENVEQNIEEYNNLGSIESSAVTEGSYKIPLLKLTPGKYKNRGHTRNRSTMNMESFNKEKLENFQSPDSKGVVPELKIPKISLPISVGTPQKGWRTSRNISHKKSLSVNYENVDLSSEIKNEAIVDNLYGTNHSDQIDKLMEDNSLSQKRKEDILFGMLDNMNLETDEDEYAELNADNDSDKSGNWFSS